MISAVICLRLLSAKVIKASLTMLLYYKEVFNQRGYVHLEITRLLVCHATHVLKYKRLFREYKFLNKMEDSGCT